MRGVFYPHTTEYSPYLLFPAEVPLPPQQGLPLACVHLGTFSLLSRNSYSSPLLVEPVPQPSPFHTQGYFLEILGDWVGPYQLLRPLLPLWGVLAEPK